MSHAECEARLDSDLVEADAARNDRLHLRGANQGSMYPPARMSVNALLLC